VLKRLSSSQGRRKLAVEVIAQIKIPFGSETVPLALGEPKMSTQSQNLRLCLTLG
jgi:hypothetical protein